MKKFSLFAIAIAIVLATAAAVAQNGNYVGPPPSVLYGTANQVGMYSTNGSQVGPDSTLTDSGTALTYSGSSGIVSNGGFSSSGSSGTGGWKCGQGTEISPSAGYVGFQCPATITTAFWFNLPAAPAGDTNNHPLIAAKDGSANEVLSFGTLSNPAGTELATASGTLTNGHLASIVDTSGDFGDSGVLPGVGGTPNLCATDTGGAANTYVIAPSPALAALTTNTWVCFIPAHTSTGASTLAVNGLAAKALTYDGTLALTTTATISSSQVVIAVYDGTEWQIVSTLNGTTMNGGSGVANTMPKWSGTHTLSNSTINNSATAGLTSDTNIFEGNNTQRLTADSSGITATTPATGTAVFTWGALPVSTNFSFNCAGTYTQATAAGGVSIAVQGATNAPTRIDAWASLDSTNPASTTYTGTKSGTYNLATTTATNVATVTPGASATQYQWELHGSIQVGASASTLNIIFYSGSGSDSVVVKAGSFCSITA